MANFTSNTYQMKREILSFSNKISRNLSKPERKFMADMNYGMLVSGSCLLTDIVDQLHESSRKINVVDRLSKHLANGLPAAALKSYLAQLKRWCPGQPVIHIDDSDVVKPDGYKFEALGWVRDGSESTDTKNVYKKGYHVTEATVLTKNNHPVSIFSEIHSSKEKDFTFINDVTFSAMERAKALLEKAAFVMDRGYDNNKMFLKLDSMEQDYVIRLTAKRKLLYHNKWTFATELSNRRKGKVKLPLFYSLTCSFTKLNWHAICRYVYPSSFIANTLGSNPCTCVYVLDIKRLSYRRFDFLNSTTGGCFISLSIFL